MTTIVLRYGATRRTAEVDGRLFDRNRLAADQRANEAADKKLCRMIRDWAEVRFGKGRR